MTSLADMMDQRAEKHILSKSWSFFIEKEGKNVGLVSVDLAPMRAVAGRPGVWLGRVKTPKEFRRMGYGTIAMRALMDECSKRRVDLYLVPNPYDDSMTKDQATAWYERLGFESDEGFLVKRGANPPGTG